MRTKLPVVLLLAALILQTAQLRAQEEKWRAGAGYGLLSAEKYAFTKTKEGPAAGVEIARKLGAKFELGASLGYAEVKYESELLPIKLAFDNTFLMLFGNFRLDAVLKGLYAGPQAGFVTRSLRKENDNIGMNAAGFGFRAGYDHALSRRLNLGVQFQYVSAGKAEKTVTDDNVKVTYSVAAAGFMQYLLSASYRF